MLTHAFRRLDRLDAPLQADVRSAIGWTMTEPEVMAAGDLIEDDWVVIGQAVERDERVWTQRSWLAGVRSGRTALVLQFAAGDSRNFGETFFPGTHGEAVLAFWPSAAPRRAFVHARKGAMAAWPDRLPGFASIEALLARFADDLARSPWARQCAGVLRDAVPTQQGQSWLLVDRAGDALPMVPDDAWVLLALSGGHPIDVMVEWNGRQLRPLLAVNAADGQTWMRAPASKGGAA